MHQDRNIQFIIIALFLLVCSGCSLPENPPSQSKVVEPRFEHWMQDPDRDEKIQQGMTAFLPLDQAFISIASRLYLIENAKYHLDLQYYIWKDDQIGNLVLYALLKAADRGVKVRLLIDDQNGTALDEKLVALSLHPNIQIKIFNPYQFRHFRVLDYGFRFRKVNHRMHNKLIIADGAIAVTGGRNISSEYFDASDNFQFTDLDIMFFGSAVYQANEVYQRFWNHDLSYPSQSLLGKAQAQELQLLRQQYQYFDQEKDKMVERINSSQQTITQILKNTTDTRWAKAYFVADPPSKAEGLHQKKQRIDTKMLQHMGDAQTQMDIVSAYFVPTQSGTYYLTDLAKKGVDVRVLTNSYLANDVPIVHAFYQNYRKDLLKHGVKIYEFKPYIERLERTWYEKATGNIIPAKNKNASSLHAKFFEIDGKVFIGSFNLDPRSTHLNTEVGLIVESEWLQKDIHQKLDQFLPVIAYELTLDAKDNIIWIEYTDHNTEIIHHLEPNTTKFQRFVIGLIAKTPFEWLM